MEHLPLSPRPSSTMWVTTGQGSPPTVPRKATSGYIPAHGWGLERGDLWGPFQPKPFCDLRAGTLAGGGRGWGKDFCHQLGWTSPRTCKSRSPSVPRLSSERATGCWGNFCEQAFPSMRGGLQGQAFCLGKTQQHHWIKDIIEVLAKLQHSCPRSSPVKVAEEVYTEDVNWIFVFSLERFRAIGSHPSTSCMNMSDDIVSWLLFILNGFPSP